MSATAAQWVEGARLRTLPAAVSPVLAGTGAAAAVASADIVLAALALVVALALQVGVNYANDYSDGVKGTDSDRVGPFRLVGSGAAEPDAVRRAAFLAFTVAGLAGLAIVVLTGHWWLIAVGAVAVAAAWYYTGGVRPYGYRGLGEVSVFIFFGLVAVLGTTFVQADRITPSAVVCAVAIGLLACALMLVNNLRDARTDAVSGKRTLAVFLGERRTRMLYTVLIAMPYLLVIALGVAGRPWALLAVVSAPLAVRSVRPVLAGATGRDLIAVLRDTGLTELAFAVLLTLGLVIDGL